MKRMLMAMAGMAAFAAAGAEQFVCERLFRPERHVRFNEGVGAVQPIDEAAWLKTPSSVSRFRCDFESKEGEELVFDVSADQRYVLWLDGREISRGPHRGYPHYWMYSTYRVTGLKPGTHRMEAVVNQLNPPNAQLGVRGAFILKASGGYDSALTTGTGKWLSAPVGGTRYDNTTTAGGIFGVGGRYFSHGSSPEYQTVGEDKFKPAEIFAQAAKPGSWHWGIRRAKWLLFPSPIPDQMHEPKTPGAFRAARPEYRCDDVAYAAADANHPMVAGFNSLLKGKPLTIPANTQVRAIWDLGDYYCAYPYLETSGGKDAEIRWGWTESPADAKGIKPHRDAFDGMKFKVAADRFVSDGRADGKFSAMWWACGKWCQIEIKTGGEPLTLTALRIAETRYPSNMEASFECDDPTIADVIAICARGIYMCSHEMFFDCPYYEQQMYGGDSRTQFLTIAAMMRDDRLVRQAIRFFDVDRRENGMLAMNTPTRGLQESATYTLCWPLMLDDHRRWRNNPEWLRARMPGLRHTMSAFELLEREDGLLGPLSGWSFIDWTDIDMSRASLAQCAKAPAAMNDLSYLLALQATARLEESLGNGLLAENARRKAKRLAAAIVAAYWDESKSLFAETAEKKLFSEHAQCLALLADVFGAGDERAERCFKALLETPNLKRTTVYYSHYLFETLAKFGRADVFMRRLDLWRDYVKKGLKTPLEMPGNARSDCHAWGSHPIYQLHATVLGVRPAASGFAKVRIAPQPAGLKYIKAKTPHPKGMIVSDLAFADGSVSGSVALPEGVGGEFVWNGKTLPLRGGENKIGLE